MRQVADHARERGALVAARPDFAAGGTEIEAHRVTGIGGEALPLDGPPGLFTRETAIEALPARTGVARAVERGLTVGARARPHRRSVHGKHPGAVGVARMNGDRKADVAHLGGHGLAHTLPTIADLTVETIDAAVILA